MLQVAFLVLSNMTTQQATVLSEIVSNAARAAESAAEAARALREAQERPRNSFSEASKVVKCSEFFGYATVDDDQNNWRDFAFSFKAWLVFADAEFDRELALIERASDVPISLPTDPGTLQRTYKLYAILSGLLKRRPLRIHRQVTDRNGYETWRQLCQLYEPRTKSRSISLLQALMSFPNFDKTRILLEQIQSLERIREEYQRTSGASLSDDIMTSTLLRVLPKHIQQHLRLQMTSTSDYSAVRQMVLSYEVASSTYSTGRIHAELGVVTSYATTSSSGPQPMEIDQIAQYDKGKGKMKGKGKEGKGKHGKGKDGKGSIPRARTNVVVSMVKEKEKTRVQTSNDGKGKNLDNNQCSYCLKFGRWRRDCHKLKDDQKHSRVRQIEEVVDDGGQGSSAASTSGTAPSNVRLVSFAPVIEEHVLQQDDSCEDLTLHYTDSSQFATSYVRVLSMNLLKPKLPDSCSRGALDLI